MQTLKIITNKYIKTVSKYFLFYTVDAVEYGALYPALGIVSEPVEASWPASTAQLGLCSKYIPII